MVVSGGGVWWWNSAMVVSAVTVLVTMSRPGLAVHVLAMVLFRPIGASGGGVRPTGASDVVTWFGGGVVRSIWRWCPVTVPRGA